MSKKRHDLPGSNSRRRTSNFRPKKLSYTLPPPNVEVVKIFANGSSMECFSDSMHMFSLQYQENILIEGHTYQSVDEYYQKMKIFELTGILIEKSVNPEFRSYAELAKEILLSLKVKEKATMFWRKTRGIEIIQNALLARIDQSSNFRKTLLATGNKIICETYGNDDFFATGCSVGSLQNWLRQHQRIMWFPKVFPVKPKQVNHLPIVGRGKNVLGGILIALREKIRTEENYLLPLKLSMNHDSTCSSRRHLATSYRENSTSSSSSDTIPNVCVCINGPGKSSLTSTCDSS